MLQPKITHVEPIERYTLKLDYEDGEARIFSVLPYISGDWYEELHDRAYFNTVHVVSNGNGIAWAHGQDIAPHELYELSIPESELKLGTVGGKPVTPEMLTELAQKFEQDWPESKVVVKSTSYGNALAALQSLELSVGEIEALERRAKNRRTSLSFFVRSVLQNELVEAAGHEAMAEIRAY